MSEPSHNRRTTQLSRTRTNGDWVMIVTGVALTLLFVAGGLFSLSSDEKAQPTRMGGPVKNPGMSQKSQSFLDAPFSYIFGHKKR